jgi:nicotinate-nucleotide--dimethylbenzimidazole phosphoribosyltransferase
MTKLEETTAVITELDKTRMEAAEARLNNLTKPPGSLGQLEEIAIKLAGMTGDLFRK